MNELLIRKHIREITKKGIPLLMAKEIVETAMEASKGKDVQTYIDYAVTLVYGMNFVSDRKTKTV